MQFNLVPYRHRIDELWAVLASSKIFKYLYYIVIKLQMLLALKSARLYFFCMPSVEEKLYLGNLLNGI